MGKGGSFWSSIPGFLTGLAGVLTAVVTLVTLAFSQGWIGGDSPAGPVRPGGQAGGGGEAGAEPELQVEPESLSFRPTLLRAVTETVTVTNKGDVAFTVDPAQLTGDDADRFEVDDDGCAGTSLPSGRSCELEVTFDPGGAGQASATLVVSVNGEERSQEVALDAVGVG